MHYFDNQCAVSGLLVRQNKMLMMVSPVGLSKKIFFNNGIKMFLLHKILVMLS